MRRYILLMGVLALLGAELGCQHVAGKCDCGYNPNDYPIPGPTAPFPTAHPAAPPAAIPPAPGTPAPPPKGDGKE
jgi:hypothetical protein